MCVGLYLDIMFTEQLLVIVNTLLFNVLLTVVPTPTQQVLHDKSRITVANHHSQFELRYLISFSNTPHLKKNSESRADAS